MDALELMSPRPVRSRLYSPEPLGLGTGMVESLASYLARLADIHLVSAPDLMDCLASGATNAGPAKDHHIYNLMQLRSRELNGLQQMARRWSTLVTTQTLRPRIDQLTLLPWRHILTSRALLHSSQYWCPWCLDDWLETGQPVYWPLLWSLRAVIICPIHRLPLEQRCHHCGAIVPSLTAQRRIGFCSKCQFWLGFAGRSDLTGQSLKDTASVTETAANIAHGALTLLATSSLIREQVAIAKIVELLQYCLHTANCRQVALARGLGLSSATALYRLIGRRHLLNLPALLNILVYLGLDIPDFVQKPVAALVSSGCLDDFIHYLPNKQRSATPSRLKQGHRANSELLADVQATLEAALTEADPPCLKTLARGVGLTTVKLLRSHFPHLCQAILDKRKSRFNLQTAKQVLEEIVSSPATPPSLETIATQLKTSPVTMRRYFPQEVAAIKARRYIIKDVTELRRNVAAFLEVDPPLPFREISRRLGIKTHHLRQHCPDLHQAIVQRFASYRHTCAVERQHHSAEAVRKAVIQLNVSGQFPTKSKVALILGRTRRLILDKSESEVFTEMMHHLGLWQR